MLPTFTGFSHGVNQKVQKLVARGQRARRTEGGGDPLSRERGWCAGSKYITIRELVVEVF